MTQVDVLSQFPVRSACCAAHVTYTGAINDALILQRDQNSLKSSLRNLKKG